MPMPKRQYYQKTHGGGSLPCCGQSPKPKSPLPVLTSVSFFTFRDIFHKIYFICILFAFLALSCQFEGSKDMPRTSISKAEWLGVLETAAQLNVEQSSAVWVWIMQELRLGPQYFLAVREAVQQGRWRTAKNPRTYLKTVAKREALKMGLVTEDNGNLVTIGAGIPWASIR